MQKEDVFEMDLIIPQTTKELYQMMINTDITHWHPDSNEIYDEICRIGKRGNVLVIKKNLLGETVLYMGEKEKCPYNPKIKKFLSKIYYLEAK